MEALAAAVRAYQALGCWAGGIEIPRELYEQALNVFESEGGINRWPPYDVSLPRRALDLAFGPLPSS